MGARLYHVLLEGRRLGPYDRRTIVGMRIKNALKSSNVLESTEGARLTVAELVNGRVPEPPPPERSLPGVPSVSSTYSLVQAMYPADLLAAQRRGYPIPAFKGEVEMRVQTKVLRVAGRFRDGIVWKEDRVKFPLQDIVHARLQGSVVELGVRRPKGKGLQRLRFDLRTPEAAGELVERLPHTVPWPGSEPLAGGRTEKSTNPLLWPAITGGGLAVVAILLWVALHRA